ncbi:MAG: bifunctional biotin--[acetyl-CoA-carboxylase] ligase/biotin operon repressor BirA [Methylococcales bacterium]
MNLSTSRKKLLRLLSDGRFRSGTSLANELGVSRTSVWKHIGSLCKLGIEIDAVTGRGYRLPRPLELLDETVIRSGLEANVNKRIGALHIHDRIDSTNRFLGSGLSGPESKGAICLAESQTAGKGRNGKNWISPFGNNIYLSLAWRYPDGPAALSGLSLAVGVAVVRTLSALGVPDIRLKWPNDIVWNGKKLGGILIELFGDAHGPCSVIIGLGLNCAMSPDQGAAIEQEWVDLDIITHRSQPGRNRLIASLINQILPVVAEFNQSGLTPFLAEWRRVDWLQGKQVVLHMGNREIAGTVAGINDEGLIQLYTRDGELRSFASGEVSFRSGSD